jgi:Ca-activated chloride channel family protein
MALALARPETVVTLPAEEGTVILTLDISGSMQAEDLQPNRMDAAKEAAKAFVERQSASTRIGVVSFSGSAAVVQAPTDDKEAVLAAIDRLRPQRATGIGLGILASLDAIFENSDEALPSQVFGASPGASAGQPTPTPLPRGQFAPATIVLLSDGENNVFPPPLQVVELAANRGVRIHTVGVGSPEGTILRIQGRAIRTRLDEATLKKVAELTEGEYFFAASETDLRRIYETLTTQIVFRTERTEVTALATAIAALFALLAAFLSLLWFQRLP